MRTKTLVLTAALGVATIATSMAQVYSVNAVGYVKVSVPVGFSIIANPLDAGTGNNVISKLFAAPPEGTTIYKFNGTSYDISSFSFGTWDTDRAMNPGEGAFILNADTKAFDNVFVGEVKQGHLVTTIPAGFSMIASQVPQAGGLTADLKYTPAENDTVYAFNNTKGSYDISSFSFGTWDTEPSLAVAQGFFLNSAAATTWTRDFSVNN